MTAKAKPAKKAKVAKRPKKASKQVRGPHIVPVMRRKRFVEPVAELPSPETLSKTLQAAAILATPGEEPETTTGRAFALWNSMQETLAKEGRVLFESAQDEEFERFCQAAWESSWQQWVDFLSACGLTPDSIAGSKKKNMSVPVKTVLKACKVLAEETEDFLTSLQAFRKREVAEFNSVLGEDQSARDASYPIPSDPSENVPVLHLRDFWISCSRYMESVRIVEGNERSALMVRARAIRRVARLVLDKTKLEPDDMALLKSLTQEEEKIGANELVICTQDSHEREVAIGRWRELVISAKSTKKALPRIIEHTGYKTPEKNRVVEI